MAFFLILWAITFCFLGFLNFWLKLQKSSEQRVAELEKLHKNELAKKEQILNNKLRAQEQAFQEQLKAALVSASIG